MGLPVKFRPKLSDLLGISILSIFFAMLPALPASFAGVQTSRAEEPGLEAMVGQMIMVGFRGTGEEPLTEDLRFLLEDIEAGKVGGVILFETDKLTGRSGRNITSLEQVKGLVDLLQSKAKIPLFIAIDQEGGRVRRLKPEHGAIDTPSAAEMGRMTPEKTREAGFELGRMLKGVGINLNLAPVADLDANPDSPAIGAVGRSFSADPAVASAHALSFAGGLLQAGVIPCFKHFPGHGSAAKDPHLDPTDISSTWREEELLPYKDMIAAGMPAMIMVGHLLNENYDKESPASMSPLVIDGLLRSRMAWKGVVITDDLQMKAVDGQFPENAPVLSSINAGADIVLLGNNLEHSPTLGRDTHAAIMQSVKDGNVGKDKIKAAYNRVIELKMKLDSAPQTRLRSRTEQPGRAVPHIRANRSSYLITKLASFKKMHDYSRNPAFSNPGKSGSHILVGRKEDL